ncbi:MAG: cell division protein FtsZ [Paraprevotella sp.]|nr:cell division protein FtsZ [Paraprevotella sp.]MBQ8282234.1 cell division protein FtsZ [Paraprevotella sp.]MBR2380202.1 cell division protein FtsZ [Paraprevotella sp.]
MPDGLGIQFNLPANKPTIIKVVGVGGGGGNAVNHMYKEGIHDVSFVVCNTDSQALNNSPIPTRLQLGTEGLGAGNRPQRAREAAMKSIDDIKNMLNDGTKMVFITAGMGGGTGTGAAPVIAQCAKDMGILTVGIVTIPFRFEGLRKIDQALDGVEEIAKHVDALLVINNERLREIYPELTVLNAFSKADDTLCIAAKSIAEIITVYGLINLDFEDVKTVMKNGGVAIMSMGYGEGEGRVKQAIDSALHSPLLNNKDIFKSKRLLLNISFSDKDEKEQLTMEEVNEIHEFMSHFQSDVETKFGMATDATLGNKVKITILASGFALDTTTDKRLHEDERKRVEDEENERVKAALRSKFYANDKDQKEIKRPRHLYIFNEEDLNDDDIISMIEDIPAYKRTKEQLESVKRKSATKDTISDASKGVTEENDPPMVLFNGII